MLGRFLLIAIRNLAQHGRRTALLGGTIALVTTLLVVLLGLSNGVRAAMFESATTLMTGHINVAGFFKVSAGQSSPLVTDYENVASLIQQKVPEIDYVLHRGRGWAKLISDTGSMQAGVGGLDITEEPRFSKVIKIKQGRLADLAHRNTLLLFEDQAKKLDVKVGDALTLAAPTTRGANNTIDLRLVAIAQNVGFLSAWNVYIPNPSLRALYQLNDKSTGVLQIFLKDLRTLPFVQARLRQVLSEAGYRLLDNDPRPFWLKFETVNREDWTGQKLDITNWEDEVSFMKWTLTAIDSLTGVLTFVLLVIIAVGIMNTLWIAIRERTREIGTLRAVGMQRSSVLWMFLLEAFVLSLGGTLVGAAFGLLTCTLLNALHLSVPLAVQLFLMQDRLVLAVQPRSVIGAIALITACTTLVSLIPSYLAARLKPITAMHHVG